MKSCLRIRGGSQRSERLPTPYADLTFMKTRWTGRLIGKCLKPQAKCSIMLMGGSLGNYCPEMSSILPRWKAFMSIADTLNHWLKRVNKRKVDSI